MTLMKLKRLDKNNPQDMLVYKDKYHLFPEGTLQCGFKIDIWGQKMFINSLRYTDEYGRVFEGIPERKFF